MTDLPTTGGSFSRDPATGKLSRQNEPAELAAADDAVVDLAPAAQPAPKRSTSKGGL